MAQRLSFDKRARIEAMRAAGVSVDETAWRLSRDPSTPSPDSPSTWSRLSPGTSARDGPLATH